MLGNLEIVDCRGSFREMGEQQGEALRDKIEGSWQLLRELEAFVLKKPLGLPFVLYRKLAAFRAMRSLRPALAREYADFDQFIVGIGKGSRLPLSSVYLLNALEPFMSKVDDDELEQLRLTPRPGACSAIAVSHNSSRAAQTLVAHNFDYLPMVQPYFCIRKMTPRQGFRSLQFTIAPLCGVVDGVNEQGLCITNNYATAQDEGSPQPTFTMLAHKALNTCKDVVSAIEFFKQNNRWGTGILMLADRSGELASLEMTDTRISVRRPRPEDENIIFHTNRFHEPQIQEIELPAEAVYNDKAPVNLRGVRVAESSELRYAKLDQLIRKYNLFTPDSINEIMSNHGDGDGPNDNTICMHGGYWHTSAVTQFDPSECKMRVSFSTACRAQFQEFSL